MTLRIREYREELQLSQSELAKRIPNVQRNVSNWENGISEPDCATILKLAEIFEITIDELFGRESGQTSKTENEPASLYRKIARLNDRQKAAVIAVIDAF